MDRALLLALDGVSVSVAAGIPGRGHCFTRLLDGVSLAVHDGDLLLLRGGTRHGTQSLLRLVAGHPAVLRRATGSRSVAANLVLRHGVVPAAALPVMVTEWTQPAWRRWNRVAEPDLRDRRGPVLYLLKAVASPEGEPPSPTDIGTWARWTRDIRRNPGAAMIVSDASPAVTEALEAMPELRGNGVRFVALSFGRIIEELAAGRVGARCTPLGGPGVTRAPPATPHRLLD